MRGFVSLATCCYKGNKYHNIFHLILPHPALVLSILVNSKPLRLGSSLGINIRQKRFSAPGRVYQDNLNVLKPAYQPIPF